MSYQHLVKLPEGVDILDMDVAISNALLRSSQGLSLFEKRLVSACLAKTGRQKWPDKYKEARKSDHEANFSDWTKLPNSPFTVRVSVDDYMRAGHVDKSTAYTQLQQASAALYDRSIHMKIKTERGIELLDFRWVEAVKYQAGEGWVELSWSSRVAEHIYNLTGKFTLYKLRQTSQLGNIYAVYLFELFASYSPEKYQIRGRYKPTLEEFIHSMDVPEAYHRDFAGIRRRVIEKAVGELRARAGLEIEWKAITRGRKTVGLDFTFGPAPGEQLVIDADAPGLDDLQLATAIESENQ